MSDDEKNVLFSEYKKLILSELDRLNKNVEKLEERYNSFLLKTSVDVGRLKVWSAITGAISGTIAAMVVKEVMSRWK